MSTSKAQRRGRYLIKIYRRGKYHRQAEIEGTRAEAKAEARVMKLHHSSGAREAASIELIMWLDEEG